MHKIKILFTSSFLFYALLLIMPSNIMPSNQTNSENIITEIQTNLQSKYQNILKETAIDSSSFRSVIQAWITYVRFGAIPFIESKNKIRLAGENKLLKKAVETTTIIAQSLDKIINPGIGNDIRQGFVTSLI